VVASSPCSKPCRRRARAAAHAAVIVAREHIDARQVVLPERCRPGTCC
jgi:hypothetical protein